ncbi:MAG: FAD-dependent oxidoreductase [Hyphomicrobiales bacterium]|nr:FAD-dependent oxidoreductase [Hyphomicrobiales bacterium]
MALMEVADPIETPAVQPASELHSQEAPGHAPVIVIGGGPSGIRSAEELARREIPVILFNAERWQPYNRVKLTPFLAGDIQLGQIYQPMNFAPGGNVTVYSGHSIIDIDPLARTVTGRFGRVWRYSKLVICTGSRAHVPPIVGRENTGVYTFRSLNDVEALMARSFRLRRAVIIGGGLLGLEAARGLASLGAQITVVEHERHLMARQLDHEGGLRLAAQMKALGISTRTGVAVRSIDGDGMVNAVSLSDGEKIPCDSVVICTGIRANIEMARDAGLAVGMGIKVDSGMRTSDPDIYAVGECAEFEGNIFGLVGPGLEQAEIAARNIAGETAKYSGSAPVTRLKVVGVDIFSTGDVDQLEQRSDIQTVTYEQDKDGSYILLALKRQRLIGAIAVGDYPDVNRVQQAVRERRLAWPWQLRRFRTTGRLWGDETPSSVVEWPGAATICNCTGVTRGRIGEAIALGCNSYAEIKRETGASTVCGSCRPLIQQLLSSEPVKHEPVKLFRPILVLGLLTIIAAAIVLFAPAWPYSQSVQSGTGLDVLWRDGYWKQVSGFTLLGLSAAAALLSLRKRLKWFAIGGFDGWRLVHVAVGLLAVFALFVHTGFRLGQNLNSWLMLSFLAIAGLGAVAGVVMAVEHRLLSGPMRGGTKPPRRIPVWLHILAFWPLPILLTLHVLSVYFY